MTNADRTVTITVGNCAGCPFVVPSDSEYPDEPWLCDADGSADGESEPRNLPEQRVSGTSWPEPPEWCPLREADRLITIRVSK